MKLLVLSDLHNEFETFQPAQSDCDVVVLAGDTDTGIHGARWALETFRHIPIIYICGNHEYYGSKIARVPRQLRELAGNANLLFLENDEWILDNVRFLGCTLWTDFCLYGRDKADAAMEEARMTMTDYRRIRLGPELGHRKLRPADTLLFHAQSVQFLQAKLEQKFPGRTVIVTHHSPTARSISENDTDLLNAAYCSDLEWMIEKYKPDVWIHGHIHQKTDCMIETTRIIANPRGYHPNIVDGFQENLILEI